MLIETIFSLVRNTGKLTIPQVEWRVYPTYTAPPSVFNVATFIMDAIKETWPIPVRDEDSSWNIFGKRQKLLNFLPLNLGAAY